MLKLLRAAALTALTFLFVLAPLVQQAGAGTVVFINAYSGSYRTFTFVGSATSTSSSVDVSSTGRQSGDIGVYLDYARSGGGAPSQVTPTGHTNGDNDVGSFARVSISYKIMTGSEGSITGINGSSQNGKIYLVFRPSIAVSTINYTNGGSEVTSGNPAVQTINPSSETTAVLLLCLLGSQGTVNPRTTSPTMSEVSASTSVYGLYLINDTSPASTTCDMDDEGNDNAAISGYIKFT